MKFLDSVSKRPKAEAVGQQNVSFFPLEHHTLFVVLSIFVSTELQKTCTFVFQMI